MLQENTKMIALIVANERIETDIPYSYVTYTRKS